MTTGERIKRIRIARGVTQKELAEAVGTTYQNISQYERGLRQPKYKAIMRIADALQVSPDMLMDDEDYEKYGLRVTLREICNEFLNMFGIDLPDAGIDRDCLKSVDRDSINGPIALTQSVLFSMSKLNEEGQKKAVERVEELTEIPKYQRKPEGPEEDN